MRCGCRLPPRWILRKKPPHLPTQAAQNVRYVALTVLRLARCGCALIAVVIISKHRGHFGRVPENVVFNRPLTILEYVMKIESIWTNNESYNVLYVLKEKFGDKEPGTLIKYAVREYVESLRQKKGTVIMDDMVRSLCETVERYTQIHMECWNKSPQEIKELMTMKFPLVQTTKMQIALKRIGMLPFDTKKAAEQIIEYQQTHCTNGRKQ